MPSPAEISLPTTHRAVVCTSTSEPLRVQHLPTPKPTPGSAVVQILVVNVIGYGGDVYNGKLNYPFPTPLVIGNSAIARVVAVGPDASSLKVGTLVLVDAVIRGRDDPTNIFLLGAHQGATEGSKKLMDGEWRNATCAEYAKLPLEILFPLNEARLLGGGLGYSIDDLAHIPTLLVPYGGLRDVGLKPGETVIIAPATGGFSSAAVFVALSMGAGKVIAMGRNKETLKSLSARDDRIVVVPISGDVATDLQALQEHDPADVFFDISPRGAAKSSHLMAGMLSLKHAGRVSLMGGIREDVTIPHSMFVHKNITLKGKWMYEPSEVRELIAMVETGVLPLGRKLGVDVVGKFKLEDSEEAFKKAKDLRLGQKVLIEP
ncbi:MAG: hypothetical protein MMC33_009638 [Icmadophila ericetorum]|nr:hypothetical protein [Icmadophila ericetorum]